MTSSAQPAADDALNVDPAADATATDTPSTAAIPAFKFPFKPSEFAPAKNAQQPWYKNGASNGHTKTPGAAPPGTRRSMGKR
ncbi:hypothetical protein [Pseudomonas protegens]|uniref:hypothetical protein n=1 Tax=Pseudomonas protegens TaxID=380021 RepID=UPI001E3F81A8|nr:hypothetical protein [Pseudomonas protegens]MCD9568026.1 hypothetical protein [Pseudomonas protegens]